MKLDRQDIPLELAPQRRLLHLETALPSAGLVVQDAQWVESLSGHGAELAELFDRYFDDEDGSGAPPPLCPFLAVIDATSSSAHLELNSLIGEQVSLNLMQADGSHRVFHGYVVKVDNLGSDNGRSLVRLGVASFTHAMHKRSDTRVFTQMGTDKVIEAVLATYPQARYQFDLSPQTVENMPVRGVTTQYGETDAAFVARLLAEEGWNWTLTHQTDSPSWEKTSAAKHCLMISDQRQPQIHQGSLRFGRPDVRQAADGLVEDTLTQLALDSEVSPNAIAVAGWEPGQLAGMSATAQVTDVVGTLEIYQGAGERQFVQHDAGIAQDAAPCAQAQHRAELRLAQERLRSNMLHGRGAVRKLQVMASFDIASHSRWEQSSETSRYCVLSISHRAANNARMTVAGVTPCVNLPESSYQQTLSAVPFSTQIVPPQPHPLYIKPTAAMESALVVGWDEASTGPLSTNRDLQLRVQFPWQRGTHPVIGGQSGPVTPQGEAIGHAPGTAASSVWVRVAQPSAGANWGSSLLARHGTEVLVSYTDGDPDRPMIVGQLHNPQDVTPWPVGEGVNHEGVLSGLHSQNHEGRQGGLNQWLMDDSTGELRMRLASGGQASPWGELSVGHLIAQGCSAVDSTRGAWLGSGFMAHTDGWVAVRAEQGLLVSTALREGRDGSAQSTQMDAREAVQQLQAAQGLGERLNAALQGQGGAVLNSLKTNPREASERVLQDIDPQKLGKEGGASKTMPDSREVDSAQLLERFDQAHIVMHASSSGAWASSGPLGSYSGQATSLSSQGDGQLSAAHTVSAQAGQTVSVYNHQGPVRLISANANVTLAAHDANLELLVDQLIAVHSVNGEITLQAKDRIELLGGDSKLVLQGGNIDYHCQEITVHGSTHGFDAGEAGQTMLEALPQGQTNLAQTQEVELNRHYDDLRPMAGAPYVVRFADGTVRQGALDAHGSAILAAVPLGNYTVEFGEDPKPWTPPPLQGDATFMQPDVRAQGAQALEAAALTPAGSASAVPRDAP